MLVLSIMIYDEETYRKHLTRICLDIHSFFDDCSFCSER